MRRTQATTFSMFAVPTDVCACSPRSPRRTSPRESSPPWASDHRPAAGPCARSELWEMVRKPNCSRVSPGRCGSQRVHTHRMNLLTSEIFQNIFIENTGHVRAKGKSRPGEHPELEDDALSRSTRDPHCLSFPLRIATTPGMHRDHTRFRQVALSVGSDFMGVDGEQSSGRGCSRAFAPWALARRWLRSDLARARRVSRNRREVG